MSYLVCWVASILLILSKESLAQNNDTHTEITCFGNLKEASKYLKANAKCIGHGKKNLN